MVNLYFLRKRELEDNEENTNDEWIRALAIPLADVQRLSLRPHKWLRFVAFAILGAQGHLYNAVPGPIVNYETVSESLTHDAASYYFVPDGPYHLIDSKALADYITSSASTDSTFSISVARRDGNRCAITREARLFCEAAHIIPHAKGDEYIKFVISQRSGLYEDWNPANDLHIDSTQNGILLSKLIHPLFGRGMCVFLKAPNFALGPADIPRVGVAPNFALGPADIPRVGDVPPSCTTLQYLEPLEPSSLLATILRWDVQTDWSGETAPPSLLLDFMYGVAIIRRWSTPDIAGWLNSCHNTFASLKPKAQSSSSDQSDHDDSAGMNSMDSEYKQAVKRKGHHGVHHKSKDSQLSRAMDITLELSMLIRGYPPGTTVSTILQKQQEEGEIRSHQIAREKVEGWLERSSAVSGQMGMDG